MNLKFILGVEAGKKAAGEILALQKRVLSVLNEARYAVIKEKKSYIYVIHYKKIFLRFLITSNIKCSLL